MAKFARVRCGIEQKHATDGCDAAAEQDDTSANRPARVLVTTSSFMAKQGGVVLMGLVLHGDHDWKWQVAYPRHTRPSRGYIVCEDSRGCGQLPWQTNTTWISSYGRGSLLQCFHCAWMVKAL